MAPPGHSFASDTPDSNGNIDPHKCVHSPDRFSSLPEFESCEVCPDGPHEAEESLEGKGGDDKGDKGDKKMSTRECDRRIRLNFSRMLKETREGEA
jgi:hypothetical protein